MEVVGEAASLALAQQNGGREGSALCRAFGRDGRQQTAAHAKAEAATVAQTTVAESAAVGPTNPICLWLTYLCLSMSLTAGQNIFVG